MISLSRINRYNIFILIGFILHCLSSYYCIGFYSDDEHFQILEPVAYLLNINNQLINDDTGYYWEWQSHIRMRPLLQVYFYYFLII